MELTLLFNRRQGAGLTTVKCPWDLNDEAPRRTPRATVVHGRPAVADTDCSHSVIDALLSINGDLESEGDVIVNGRVCGNITCKTLIVGADASIKGGILADQAVIRGKIKGIIRAGNVRIESAARIEGDIYHSTLSLEEGAIFQGASRCRKDPKSIDIGTERQVAELNKAAEMMAQDRPENGEHAVASTPPLAELGARPPLAAKRKSNGRRAALS